MKDHDLQKGLETDPEERGLRKSAEPKSGLKDADDKKKPKSEIPDR